MPATRTISTTIALNGEAAYRRSMEEINRSLRTLKAETQAAAAAFQSEGRTMQSLTNYQQRLQTQYEQLLAKRQSLNQAVREAARLYGDNSKEADRHRAALANVEAEMNRLQGEMNRTESELQELRQAEENARLGADQMSDVFQGASLKMGVASVTIGNLLTDLVRKTARFVADTAKQGVAYNAEMQSYTQALTNSLGSAEAAAAALNAIKLDAAVTPYSVAALTRANQLLISTGISAESARATINALSEAVSATGGGNDELQRMAQNLQQIQNVGKASAMDIKQFQMAGIDVFGVLADYTGKTVQEVQDLTITYDLLSKALQAAAQEGGRYFGSNAAQAQTLNGQISTLKDNIQSKLGEAFKPFSDSLTNTAIPAVNEFVQSLDLTTFVYGLEDALQHVMAFASGVREIVDEINRLRGLGGIDTEGMGVDELNAVLAQTREQMESVRSLMDNGFNTGSTRTMYDALANTARQLEAEIERLCGTVVDTNAELESSAETLSATAQEAQALADQIAALEAAYNEAYEAAKTSLEGQFDLFEQVDQAATISVRDMIAAMGTQADYWNAYSENLTRVQGLTEESIGLNADLVAGLNDGSAKSVQAVASLAKGYEEALARGPEAVEAYIASINAAYESQQAAIAGAADAMAKSQTDFDAQMEQIREKAKNLAQDMDQSEAMLTSGERSMKAFIEGIAKSEGEVQDRMFAIGRVISERLQAGIDSVTVNGPTVGNVSVGGGVNGSHASGLDRVPYDGYIAELHKDEMILNAEVANAVRRGAGVGSTVVNVTVNTREMSRSQTDYLIRQLNQELGKEA